MAYANNTLQVMAESHRDLFTDLAEMHLRMLRPPTDKLRALLGNKRCWRVGYADDFFRCWPVSATGETMGEHDEIRWPAAEWRHRLTEPSWQEPVESSGDDADDMWVEAWRRSLVEQLQKRRRSMH